MYPHHTCIAPSFISLCLASVRLESYPSSLRFTCLSLAHLHFHLYFHFPLNSPLFLSVNTTHLPSPYFIISITSSIPPQPIFLSHSFPFPSFPFRSLLLTFQSFFVFFHRPLFIFFNFPIPSYLAFPPPSHPFIPFPSFKLTLFYFILIIPYHFFHFLALSFLLIFSSHFLVIRICILSFSSSSPPFFIFIFHFLSLSFTSSSSTSDCPSFHILPFSIYLSSRLPSPYFLSSPSSLHPLFPSIFNSHSSVIHISLSSPLLFLPTISYPLTSSSSSRPSCPSSLSPPSSTSSVSPFTFSYPHFPLLAPSLSILLPYLSLLFS